MAKFVFRLQSYLDLKGKLENQRKLEYGQAIAELEREKQKKAALVEEKNSCVNLFKKQIETRIDSLAFVRYNHFLDAIKQRIIAQDEVISKAEALVEERRLGLIEAMRERKTLETLRDNEKEEFMIEELKAEQKVTDEIVSYQYNKREV